MLQLYGNVIVQKQLGYSVGEAPVRKSQLRFSCFLPSVHPHDSWTRFVECKYEIFFVSISQIPLASRFLHIMQLRKSGGAAALRRVKRSPDIAEYPGIGTPGPIEPSEDDHHAIIAQGREPRLCHLQVMPIAFTWWEILYCWTIAMLSSWTVQLQRLCERRNNRMTM